MNKGLKLDSVSSNPAEEEEAMQRVQHIHTKVSSGSNIDKNYEISNKNPGSGSDYSSVSQQMLECLSINQGVKDGLTLGLDRYNFSGQNRRARGFCTSVPIPFSAFEGIQRSKHNVQLTANQEENVMKSFDKLVKPSDESSSSGSPTGSPPFLPQKVVKEISTPLPFVSVFIDQHCPELRNGVTTASPASGATYLLLSVVTGHTRLCGMCLKAGANPNNVSFLKDENPAEEEMSHGYSPIFIAALAEQIEIMDLLSMYGGSVRVYDRWGRTPLHAAVAINSPEVVQWLLGKGAPRYLGDCLNLIPAESAEEDYFPDLAMPNAALYGGPSLPPNSYFSQQVLPEQAQLQGSNNERHQTLNLSPIEASLTEVKTSDVKEDVIEKTVNVSSPEKADDSASISALATSDIKIKEANPEAHENIVKCHCHSGRAAGYCGCVDDMYLRWSFDRLKTTWCPAVDFVKLARQQQQAPTMNTGKILE
ncbi:unnamed protein product [Phytomonas sp. Hart1]|nr:unnamed protein product [Phytomonas sp. Hart1]|eukprot:CCW68815.1 unnamed protein product [Phytomonas sp. isolate Hart1]